MAARRFAHRVAQLAGRRRIEPSTAAALLDGARSAVLRIGDLNAGLSGAAPPPASR